jgi:hypothetical protein
MTLATNRQIGLERRPGRTPLQTSTTGRVRPARIRYREDVVEELAGG